MITTNGTRTPTSAFARVVKPEAAVGVEVGYAVGVDVGEEIEDNVVVFAVEDNPLEGEMAKDCKTEAELDDSETGAVADVEISAVEVMVIVMLLLLLLLLLPSFKTLRVQLELPELTSAVLCIMTPEIVLLTGMTLSHALLRP